jgi:hypothetical protein
MRHIWSLIAGIVIAPLGWFLLAVVYGLSNEPRRILGLLPTTGLLLLLALIGMLYGLLATLRISPAGALFTAFAYLLPIVLTELNFRWLYRTLSTRWQFGDVPVDLFRPLNLGIIPIIGGIMLISAFSFSRWRDARPGPAEPVQPGGPVSAVHERPEF